MHKDNNLDDTVREAIDSRRMPLYSPAQLWGGPGSGAACSICEAPIEAHSLEYELVFRGDKPETTITHHVHVACYTAWERAVDARFGAKWSCPPGNGKTQTCATTSPYLSFADALGTIRTDDSLCSGSKPE
jgi:hypothetical protein